MGMEINTKMGGMELDKRIRNIETNKKYEAWK